MSRTEHTRTHFLTALALLWLAGTALRLTILAVPPVIPLIHDELNLSATEVGFLTGLPSMLFALAAVPGSLLIARLGVKAALVVGLALTAVGGALRGALPDAVWLYLMTIAMGAGVAITQVTMPPAVRAWVPNRIGFATAVYTNGLLVGEILPVVLMFPLVLPLAGGSWQWSFVIWSLPVAIIAVIVLVSAPTSAIDRGAPPRRWWPDWRNALIWRLGIMLGTINATYFATNGFVPDYLRSTGQSEWIGAALSGLNTGQLPASFLLLIFSGRLERKTWPYIVCGLLCVFSTVGIVFGTGALIVAAATLQGFAASAILILVLALPALLSKPDDVHRVTAAMFTISYSCAVIVPVISGLAWDLTGIAKMAFLPIALCGILLVILAPAINHVPRTGANAMRPIPVGAKGSYTLRVTPAQLANQFKDAALPPVFATPMMVTAMENAALNAVRGYLDPGESAVGTEVNIRHLAATPVGHQIIAEAVVTKVDGRRIEFDVSARDEIEEIGNGTHERMVVDIARLNQRLSAKARGKS